MNERYFFQCPNTGMFVSRDARGTLGLTTDRAQAYLWIEADRHLVASFLGGADPRLVEPTLGEYKRWVGRTANRARNAKLTPEARSASARFAAAKRWENHEAKP